MRIRYDWVFEASVPDASVPPTAELRGVLKTAGTREPIEGALVTAGEREAVSDATGTFAFDAVAAGQVRITVTAGGFTRFESTETLKPGERTEVVYFVQPTNDLTRETVVRGEREKKEIAQVKLSQSEIKSVAGTRGDAFRVVQNLPGVARSPFGGGALVIRGSKSWDSRIYVDDIQIPQLFHFGGVTSTFNSNAVEDISFQPGNFGSPFGRSIGGLVRATVRTPSKTVTHGYADVNPFDVSALIETPVSENWSVSASARRGLIDVTLPFALKTFAPQAASAVGFTLSPVYWDYQARAEYRRPNSANRFFVSLFGSSDAWSFTQPNPFLDPDSEGNQGSYGTSTLYNRLTVGIDQRLGDRVTLYSRNSVGFDQYVQTGSTTDIAFRGTQFPVQLRERLRIDVPEVNLSVDTGLDVLAITAIVDAQSPPSFKANQVPDPFVERRLLAEKSTTLYVEPAVFAEATWSPLSSLQLTAGLRVDYESYMNDAWVDPRLAARWSPLSMLTLKGAFGIYRQPPDYRTGQLSPVFGNPALAPEGARHYALGAEVRFTDFLELDLNGYYKDLFSQARQVLSNGFGSDVNIPGAESRLSSQGYGRAYGGEVLLRWKPYKNFFGWVAYSLSRFDRDYYGDVLYAPGPLDQPHNLIVVASYKLPLEITVGARFRYASGPLVTPIATALYDASANYYYPLPGLPWSERLPDFVQLDVRLDKRFTFKTWSLSVYADVQNVTNAQNAEGTFYNFDYTQKQYVYGIPFLPAVGVRAEL